MNAPNDIEMDAINADYTVPETQRALMDDDLPTPRSGFDKYYHDEDPLHAWYHFPRLIALFCLLLCALVIFPLLYMHRLTELPMDTVTDTTGSVYTGGILWRLTCFVCLILLLIIVVASSATLGGNGFCFLFALGLVETFVGVIVWEAVSSEPTLETDKGCEGDRVIEIRCLDRS